MSDHVGIIAKGRMVGQGPRGDLRAQAKRTIALRTTDDDRAIQVVPGLSYDGDRLVSTRADDAFERGVSALRGIMNDGATRAEMMALVLSGSR